MELWLWVINGIIWLIAGTLVGIGSRKLLVGLRWLRQAENYLKGEGFDKVESGFLDLKSRTLDIANKILDLEIKMLKERLNTNDITQQREEAFKSIDRIDDELEKVNETRKFFRDWGNIREVTGSREIALAAALFAGASVIVGISGVLIALFMN